MNGIGNIKSVSLDTSVFIYFLENNPEFGQKSRKVFEQIIKKNIKASTSMVTLTELLSAPNIADPNDLQDQFFQTPNLTVYPIDQKVATEAARIRRQYKFRLGDSLQLATALVSKSQTFITNDASLKRFKELKIILISEII